HGHPTPDQFPNRMWRGHFVHAFCSTANAQESVRATHTFYILVIVNVPLPLQPAPPARDQLPEIVFPLTVPVRVSVLPPGEPDRILIPNWPETLPLKFPLSANVPLSVSPDTKHAELVEKWKLLTVRVPLVPVAISAVVKANI